VGGEGDDIGHAHRSRVDPAGDEAGGMGRVEHESGADRVGDLPERQRVDDAGISGRAGHDELGLLAAGHVGHLVEVDDLPRFVRVAGGGRDAVGDEAPDLGGDAGRRPVGQVAPVVETHGQDGVARLEQGLIDGQVGRGPGMGLHVGVLGTEERCGPPTGQFLDLVDDLIAAVVAPSRISLGVLVGEHRARRGEDGRRGEVLRGDELQGGGLPLGLVAEQAAYLGIAGEPLVERGGGTVAHGLDSCLSN
jgi:hypothetical protein